MSEDIEIAREELEQYQLARRNIMHLREKIAHLRSRICAAGRQPKEADIQYNADPKLTEDLLATLIDLQNLYGQKQIQAERLCFKLEVRIGDVSGLPGLVLELKYIQGKHFDGIARELTYSYRQIKRFHNQGLESYSKRWPPMSHDY